MDGDEKTNGFCVLWKKMGWNFVFLPFEMEPQMEAKMRQNSMEIGHEIRWTWEWEEGEEAMVGKEEKSLRSCLEEWVAIPKKHYLFKAKVSLISFIWWFSICLLQVFAFQWNFGQKWIAILGLKMFSNFLFSQKI